MDFIKKKYLLLLFILTTSSSFALTNYEYDKRSKSYHFYPDNFFKKYSHRPLITILWSMGSEDQFTTNYEFKRLWPFVNFASSIGYEVKLNTQALIDDYKNAIKDDQNFVLIISAHGDEEGYFLDYNSNRIPRNIFHSVSRNLRQIVWATCYGADMVDLYKIPKEINVRAWKGEIDSYDMFEFINSSKWRWLEDLLRE